MPIPLRSQPAPRPPRSHSWRIVIGAAGLTLALFLLGFRTWELAGLLVAILAGRWLTGRR